MGDLAQILSGNVAGDFFVDNSCIDCDLCRQIAPEVFVQEDGYSVVHRQPRSESARLQAQKALVACPAGSIGTRQKADLSAAIGAYPEHIAGDVYFCGFASKNSFGAKSYLIVRPGGNVLVDSPRFSRLLVRRLEAMGGVGMMFLTHRDDVADHEKFREHFECTRVIHGDEAVWFDAEHLLEGERPVELAGDLTAIPTPGHTRGHTVLLYDNRFLFTGDHLAWSPTHARLIAFRRHNWFSWPETIRSMARLKDYRFEWILPGHGRPAHYGADEMRQKVADCVEWMHTVA